VSLLKDFAERLSGSASAASAPDVPGEAAASAEPGPAAERLATKAEAACGEAFSRIAETMTPAALAWAEAANPEALAAYREVERRVTAFLTPRTPEELAGLKAALAGLEAAWERARSGYPVMRVQVSPKAGRITAYLSRPVESEVLDRFAARLKAAMKTRAEIAFRLGAPEEGRGVPVRSLREIEAPPERPPVRPGDMVVFRGLEGKAAALEPDPYGLLEGETVRVEFPGHRPLWALSEQLESDGPGRWRLKLPHEALVPVSGAASERGSDCGSEEPPQRAASPSPRLPGKAEGKESPMVGDRVALGGGVEGEVVWVSLPDFIEIALPNGRTERAAPGRLVPAGPRRWRLDAFPALKRPEAGQNGLEKPVGEGQRGEPLPRAKGPLHQTHARHSAASAAGVASAGSLPRRGGPAEGGSEGSGARAGAAKAAGSAEKGAAQLSLFAPGAAAAPASRSPSPWEAWLDGVETVRASGLPEWREALAAARAVGVCGWDFETTGLDPLLAEVRLAQIAVPIFPETNRVAAPDGRGPEPGSGCRVHLLDLFALGEPERREALEALAELVADPAVAKAGANLKFDLGFLRAALGRRLPAENLFDVVLASQLAWAGYYRLERTEKAAKRKLKEVYPAHDLASLCRRHLGVELDKAPRLSGWAGPLSPEQARYAALDAAVLLPLREILAELIARNGLGKAAELEFGLIPATAEMELAGMPFDAGAARELLARLRSEREGLAGELVRAARGAGFRARPKRDMRRYSPDLNPNSPEDAAAALRLLCGRDVEDTREETLKDLAAEGCRFAETLLAYRRLAKREAFVEEWLKSQHPADDRIRAQYRQLNPRGVGRYSCSEPNLQQVVSRGSDAGTFRSLFRAPEGRALVVGDYSNIELRAVAAVAGDEAMLAAFREGKDLHRLTAAAVTGKREEEIAREERLAAKPVNFGLIYGAGPGRLAASARYDYGVEMGYEQAKAAREAFFRAYPGIARWHQAQSAVRERPEPHWFHSHERGWHAVPLVCVRIRPDRKRVWPNWGGRTVAPLTEIFNTGVQGAAASVLKLGMARLYRALLQVGWGDVRIVGSVHDELLLECPEEQAGEVAALLRRVMEEAGRKIFPEVPIEFDVAVGKSWADKT
jgi:DNA polymerase-1